ncbi:MAG: LysR family transcriptional regulator [Oscillospiraceae bacterium]|nr:LysR family transcriptional regulator [Oscillospiraceae bacterium]
MTTDQIRYFLEIGRCGSIIEAAKQLYITQPTLSRQIAGMESELGLKLFQRSRHGVQLTPAGETLYNQWSTLADLYTKSVREAAKSARGMTESLSIGVLDGLKIDGFLPRFLFFLRNLRPDVHLILRRLSFAEIIEDIRSGRLDLAFSLDVNFFGHPELFVQNVKPYSSAIVVPARHPLAGKEKLTIADLKDETLVIVNREECEKGVEVIADVCKKYGGFIPKFQYVPSMANVLLWLESGLRCAILSMEISLNESADAKVFPLAGASRSFVQMACSRSAEKSSVVMAKEYFAGQNL